MSNKSPEKNKAEFAAEDTVAPELPEFDESGFCIAIGVKKIENNTERLINLPALESCPQFPTGIRLWPGITTVPNQYWRALEEYSPDTQILCGDDSERRLAFLDAVAQGKRTRSSKRTGMDTIKYLLTPTKIVKADGIFHGPQITVYEPEQCDQDDGPRLPPTLEAYKEDIALKLIAHVRNKEALLAWAKGETDPRRSSIKQAALARAASL
jgi:hypothetical protein